MQNQFSLDDVNVSMIMNVGRLRILSQASQEQLFEGKFVSQGVRFHAMSSDIGTFLIQILIDKDSLIKDCHKQVVPLKLSILKSLAIPLKDLVLQSMMPNLHPWEKLALGVRPEISEVYVVIFRFCSADCIDKTMCRSRFKVELLF